MSGQSGQLGYGRIDDIASSDDFEGMTAERAKDVLQEVSLSDEAMKDVVKRIRNKAVDLAFDDWKYEPIVSVGIVSGAKFVFS